MHQLSLTSIKRSHLERLLQAAQLLQLLGGDSLAEAGKACAASAQLGARILPSRLPLHTTTDCGRCAIPET